VVAEEVMITDPITTSTDIPAIQAFKIMEQKDISQILVTNRLNKFIGVVHIHDIMKEGLSK
jgi:arabinose-5-phosphate isomerase